MYLITEEEQLAVLAMHQAYQRLKELGWQDIVEFTCRSLPKPTFLLGIELGSLRPMECECHIEDDDIVFTTMDDHDLHDAYAREVEPIMFRHYEASSADRKRMDE